MSPPEIAHRFELRARAHTVEIGGSVEQFGLLKYQRSVEPPQFWGARTQSRVLRQAGLPRFAVSAHLGKQNTPLWYLEPARLLEVNQTGGNPLITAWNRTFPVVGTVARVESMGRLPSKALLNPNIMRVGGLAPGEELREQVQQLTDMVGEDRMQVQTFTDPKHASLLVLYITCAFPQHLAVVRLVFGQAKLMVFRPLADPMVAR